MSKPIFTAEFHEGDASDLQVSYHSWPRAPPCSNALKDMDRRKRCGYTRNSTKPTGSNGMGKAVGGRAVADKLADQVSYLIAGAVWRLDAKVKASAGASAIPIEQWRVLALLVERNGRTMSSLAQHAFLEPPTLTKMVDRMVADGLVYRVPDAEDRRRILIFLSDAGEARFSSLEPAVAAQERRVRKQLGRGGVAALKRLLDDLSAPEIADQDRLSGKRPDDHRAATP